METSAPHEEVQASNVHKRYALGESELVALRGVSLSVQSGELVALAGPSGSGKTTLLNLIGCLDRPSEGEIRIGGRKVSEMGSRELAAFRARSLGFVFQTFNLLPVLSAAENVEYPLLKRSELDRQARRKLAEAALERVGLARFHEHRPSQLSGGQRQRVAIARAFAHRPRLIIADEPTANLDRKTSGGILDLFSELNRELGLTFIVASHDPLVLNRMHRIVSLSDGALE